MIAKSWQYVKKYYFFMVTISVLFLVFDRNILRSVETEHFKNFQRDSQSLRVNLNHLIHGATISIKHLVTLFLGCSCFMILWPHRFSYGQNMALISTLWISVIAPTAWFLVFKNHAYFHTHVDHIVWSMPFVILGMVLVAVTCQLVCKAVWQQIRPHFLSTHKHYEML